MLHFTGERYLPNVKGIIEAEHLHRYIIASELVMDKDVLDIACGEGYGSHMLAAKARSVLGVDVAHETIIHAQQKYSAPNLRFTQGDCSVIPVATASIDVVVSFETIEHHLHHSEMLAEIRRVLRPEGLLIMSSPNRPEYNKTLTEPNPFHVKELDFLEFSDLLSKHFKNIVYYNQGHTNGSLIFSQETYIDNQSKFRIKHQERNSSRQPSAIYFVALASNATPPKISDSLFESESSTPSEVKYPTAECRIYFSELINNTPTGYSEDRAIGVGYILDGQKREITIDFPSEITSVCGLRLDISNCPALIILHSLRIHDELGTCLWEWDIRHKFFTDPSGIKTLHYHESTVLICVDGDPRFELLIPREVLPKLQPNSRLRLTITPLPAISEIVSIAQRGGGDSNTQRSQMDNEVETLQREVSRLSAQLQQAQSVNHILRKLLPE
jgi:ubiquinone/menaquinone biosynthesis C-methylase UbiE